jgi:hypothetical protein
MSCSISVTCLLTLLLLVKTVVSCDTDGPTCFAASEAAEKVDRKNHDDSNDPDMIMQMQMRVGIEHVADKQDQRQPKRLQEEVSKPSPEKKLWQEVEAVPVVPASTAITEQKEVEVVARAAVPVFQLWLRSESLLQMMSVIGLAAICFVVCRVVEVMQRKASAKTSGTIDPSAKLQQLLRALRFDEPECADEIKLLPADPAKATDDSGNNTEEEPEAEAAVDTTTVALAIAQHAKKFANESCQLPAVEVCGQKKAQDVTTIDLEARVISC